ncbi:MAG: hypothetical protein KGJ84_01385 [Elusimicrobia bacterium]|nr:hypothetical protein [Elusimicrobiota bacterium]
MTLTAVLAAGFFAPSPAAAATLTWTGAANADWFNAGNWSPAQVPTSADDATIDANVTVTLAGGTPAAFNSLTLGDSSGSFAPTLKLSGTLSTSGSVLIEPNAVLQQDASQQSTVGQLTVVSGGRITHSANSTARSFVVNLNVTGNFDLQSGATITASGLGYTGGAVNQNGNGPGAGLYGGGSGSGGGHGGAGGISNNTAGGAAYDSVTNPTDLGSGGGGAYYGAPGGNGGGAVLLNVGGILSLNGFISANGGNGAAAPNQGNGAGGGAGGTVNLTAATITGAGSIQANGGAGAPGYGDGGGAGGRIALTATTNNTYSGSATAANGTGNQNGGAGTVAVKNPGDSAYSLSIGAPSATPGAYTPVPASPVYKSISLYNCNVVFDTTTIFTANSITVFGTANSTVNNIGFNPGAQIEVMNGGNLNLTAQSLSGGGLTVDSGGIFREMNTTVLNFTSVLVASGGSISHAANAAFRSAILNLNVSGDFSLQAGATIAVDGLGYTGGALNQSGNGPGAGLFNGGSGSGGGHGGAGGVSNNTTGGATYDSVTNPTDLGSGGGAAYYGAPGGNGGGAVLLNVGGTLSLDGFISANGGNGAAAPNQGNGAGGGAGGTVNLTVAAISGTGTISAKGGNGAAGYGDGGGAGGRVAITATTSNSYAGNVTAANGTGNMNGGAGTVAVKNPGDSLFSLTVGTPSITAGAYTPLAASPVFSAISLDNSSVYFDSTTSFSANSISVLGTVNATAGTLNFNGGAVLAVVPAGVLNMTAQSLSGGALSVAGGGLFRQMNTAPLSFTSVSVASGGSITHAANAASRSAVLNLTVTGDFSLQAGATIAVDGLGYTGGALNQSGNGPGAGLFNGGSGGGGGHGGAGGVSNNAAGGAAYDNITNPTDLGSGGGGAYYGAPGGNGGGAVLLNVGGTLSLDGFISANGTNGSAAPNQGNGAGGGAGGTVNLTAAAISGTGAISAKGGNGAAGYGDGGGAGGRVAITATTSNSYAGSVTATNGTGNQNGGAGTVVVENPGDSAYSLTVGAPSITAGANTPLGASPVFSAITLDNSNVAFDTTTAFSANSISVLGTVGVTAAIMNFTGGSSLSVGPAAVLNVAAQSLSGAALNVSGTGVFRQMNTASLGFASVVVAPGGVLTHAANSTARSAVVNLNVTGDFNLQAGATIAVDGLGYTGGALNQSGNGPGAGLFNGGSGSGGGHGGAGGNSNNTAGGAAYDSSSNPADLGSGGGGAYYGAPGGNGGGAVLLNVGGNLFLNGRITANGTNGSAAPGQGNGAGGGAGGAVNLTAAAISGTGAVSANGGTGAPGYGDGGGAGGRVALTGCNANAASAAANGGAGGKSSGAAGSVSPTVPPTCPSAPSTPANPAVTATGENAAGQTFITATWGSSTQALFYTLSASTAPDFTGTQISTQVASTTGTVAGVTPNATYYLRVKAVNGIGDSGYATTVTTTTPIDLTAPQAPSLLSATGRPAGIVSLAWRASSTGEVTVFFNLYRATYAFAATGGLAPILLHSSATTYLDDPPADGVYFYAVAALDSAFNESGLSVERSAPSLHAGPAAPEGLSAAFSTTVKDISLSWSPSTGAAVGYNVYRATYPIASVASRTPLQAGTTATTLVDSPSLSLDASYYYLVTALDSVGNEGAPSALAGTPFDTHSPVIQVSRVTNGQYTSGNLTPSIAITDFSSFDSTTTLNGQPFVSTVAIYQSLNQTVSEGGTASLTCATGTIQSYTSKWATSCGNPQNCGTCPIDGTSCSVVYDNAHCGDVAPGCSKDGRLAINCGVAGVTLTQPGTYFLAIQAQDAFANASSATLSFTIDKASPTLLLVSPSNGLITNQNVNVVFQSSDDFTPASQLIVKDELGSVVVSPYAITAEGTRSLTLTARDLAGNAASAGAVFILDKTPPVAVADLRLTSQNKALGQATLAWTSPHDALSGTAGYLIKTATFPITSANFASATTIDYSSAPLTDGSTEQFVVAVATSQTVYFALKSSDAAGNFSAVSNVAFWDVDGPLLSGLTPPSGANLSRPTTFLLQASDLSGVASVVLSVDGAAISTVTNPPYAFRWNTLNYADGSHAIRFDALDTVGNPSTLAASYTLAYQPPPAPVITSPTGTYATIVATVTFTGTAEAGTTVQIQLNGFPLTSGSADSSGHFSLLATLPGQGSLVLTAVSADAKGAGSPSTPVTVNYNLTAPNPPAALDAQTLPAGHVALTWQAPAGKIPSSYNVYRSADPLALSTSAAPSPSLRVLSGVTGAAANDLPPLDGLFYYGATSLDLSGNESGLSNIAPAASDRAVPTAAVALLDAPPLGPGAHAVRLTLSKMLAAPPLLTFTPGGQGPIPLTLSASSPTVWIGTLTVASAMASGTGAFAFEGTDFAGNVGHAITSGGTAAIDTTPPGGTIALSPGSPVKAGAVALTLTLTKPVPAAPALAYVLANGATIPVTLAGGPAVWTGTLAIAPGTDGTANFLFSAADALGNAGTALTGPSAFVIDTTAPSAPTLLHALSKKAGVVALTWSAPLDGTPASYSVYRGGVRISSGLAPLTLGAGAFDDLPPSDGTYAYAVSAVDAAGNEGPLSGSAPQISRRAPPPAPVSFVAQLNAFNRIELSWQAASTETPSGYNLYRSTSAIASLAGVAPVLVSTPPVTDTPASNGLYYYAVTALDFAGNESSSFAATQFLWDNAPPVIALTGVQDAHFYNRDLAPSFTVTDLALATATVQASLDGAAFVSGSTVSAEGAHVLSVTGANQAGVGSTTTVHFTLDKTPPAVTIAGVTSGLTYNAAATPVVNATDANLASVSVSLDGAAYTPGVPISANGRHLLSVTAADLAGNVTVSSVAFTLALPPSAPQGVALVFQDGAGATLTWTPSNNVLGYRVYKDGVLKTQGLLGGTNFTDAAYVFDGAHAFAVSAVDLGGQEGDKTLVTMPNVGLTLASYGLTDANGAAALNRGFFDTLSLSAANGDAQSRLLGPALLELVGAGQTLASATAPAASAAAGGVAILSGVIPAPAALPDAASLRATLTVQSQLGTVAKIVKVFPVAARTPSGPVVQIFSEPLVLGTSPKVQLKLNNQGSAALEVKTSPSDALVQLLTTQGTLLSSAKVTQTGNGALSAPSGYYVSVPPGGSVLLDAVPLPVPPALGASGNVTASVAQTYNGLATGSPLTGQGFSNTQTYSGVTSPPYNATVVSDRQVYDQSATVLLTGVAVSTDGTNTLIPGATVQVGVSLRGFDRVASTMTDASGHYQVAFSPTPGEAGLYALWASNPSVTNHVPQSSFTIVGFGFQYANYSAGLVQNSTASFKVNLLNTGQSPLTGLSAQISTGGAAGVGLTLDPATVPASLNSGQSAALSFAATASLAAALGASAFTVTARDGNGFTRTLPVTVTVAPSAAVPAASPQTFNVGMAAGTTRTLTVVLTNQGTQAWTGVTVSAPALPWVSVQGSASLGDVPPGGSAQLNLLLAPPSNLASQAYASNPLVSINSTNAAPIPINTGITITASGQGAVLYSAINADKPRDAFGNGVGVAGAKGTLTSLDIAGLTFSADGDANGGVRFTNVPAGKYAAQVSASGFQTQNFTQVIEPGLTTSREVLLPTDVVSYTWTVTPTTVVDQYNINLSITFKTDVPAPAVVMDPAVLNFNLPDTGGDVDSQITVTNKGVIAAHNVNVTPNVNDPAVTITVPYSNIPTLNAGQSVVVPIHLHLAHASCHTFQIVASDDYTCAAGVTVTQNPPPVSGSAGSCFPAGATGTTSTPPTGFGGSSAAGTGSSAVSLSVPGGYVSVAIPNPPAVPSTPNSCQAPTNKQPSNCAICDQIAAFSDPGGDPRVPETDLSLNVPIFGGSLDFTRVYDSQDLSGVSLGPGWMHSFESRVYLRWAQQMFFRVGDPPQWEFSGGGGGGSYSLSYTEVGGMSPTASKPADPDVIVEVRTPDGRRLTYRRNSDGTLSPPVGETAALTMSGSTTTPAGYTWTLLDKTVYRYDGSGKLQTITDRNGNVVTLDYSGGQLADVKDPNGRILYTFTYGSNGRLATVTDLAARSVNFSYVSAPLSAYVVPLGNSGNGVPMLSQAVGPKGTTAYGYSAFTVPGIADIGHGALVDDAFVVQNSASLYMVATSFNDPVISLLTSVTAPNGFVTTFTLGAPQHVVDYTAIANAEKAGQLTSGGAGGGLLAAGTSHPTENKGYYTPVMPTGPNSFTIDKHTFAEWYYPQKFWTLSESGPLGNFSMDYTIDELLEQGSTVVTDPRGFKTTHKWKTVNGQTVSTDIVDPDNAATNNTFDAQNNPTQATDRAGHTTSAIFDAKNNPTKITNAAGQNIFLSYESNFNGVATFTDTKGNSTQFNYDAKGNMTRAQDALGNAVDTGYDAHGAPISITNPLGRTIALSHDTNGNLASISDSLSRTTQLGYDGLGRTTSLTDATGKATQFQYDANNNLTQVKDALNGLTNFDYASGQLTSGKLLSALHDANSHTTTFSRDTRDRLTSITNALGQTRNYKYDDANNVTQKTKADGTVITFQYDNLGRLTNVNLPGNPVTNSYDAVGNLVDAGDSFSDTKIGYDTLGRPVKVLETNKGANFTSEIDYEYDAAGNRTKMTLQALPTPFIWTYTYDGLNRTTSLTNPFNQMFTLAYDAASRRTSLTYHNGIQATYAYDATDMVTNITYKRTSDQSFVASSAYTYDAVGSRLTMTNASGTHSYGYDPLHRLTNASHPVASSLPVTNEAFAYDSVGNRTADALRASYNYDVVNRITQDSAYTYASDANGNLTSRTDRATGETTRFVYDDVNRLIEVDASTYTVAKYKYDAAGRRIERNVGATTYRYVYDGANILAILDGSNNLVQLFTQGPGIDAPLSVHSGGQDYFYHQDALGSVTALTNSSGTTIETVEYEAYGSAVVKDANGGTHTVSTVGNTFLYTGREFDSETGLYYFRARYYDPNAGSFFQADPNEFSESHYYANANPLSNIDPTGQITIPFIGWIDVGETAGQKSAEWYADKYNESGIWGKIGWGSLGLAASLWTPCTSDKTATVLAAGYTAGSWAARPYWQYSSGPGYESKWLTRGWGWDAPYPTGIDARTALNLPEYNPATFAQQVTPRWWQPIAGPRAVAGGTGWEYYITNWSWSKAFRFPVPK